jgi:hypothetical protein
MINYCVRTGDTGGIFPKISFLGDNMDYVVKTWFFNMFFHIIITLVLGNIFLGVIVDTFAELRDLKVEFENDLKNICFICQMTRDKAASKLEDFDEHASRYHSIWQYVDFIIYLFINNANNFTQYELEAYDKLKQSDMSWIPIDESSEE